MVPEIYSGPSAQCSVPRHWARADTANKGTYAIFPAQWSRRMRVSARILTAVDATRTTTSALCERSVLNIDRRRCIKQPTSTTLGREVFSPTDHAHLNPSCVSARSHRATPSTTHCAPSRASPYRATGTSEINSCWLLHVCLLYTSDAADE